MVSGHRMRSWTQEKRDDTLSCPLPILLVQVWGVGIFHSAESYLQSPPIPPPPNVPMVLLFILVLLGPLLLWLYLRALCVARGGRGGIEGSRQEQPREW